MSGAKDDCKRLFLTLRSLVNAKEVPPAFYIREFLLTEACDSVFDLKAERQELAAFVGSNSLGKIQRYDEGVFDQRRAAQAVLHFRSQHDACLKEAVRLCSSGFN